MKHGGMKHFLSSFGVVRNFNMCLTTPSAPNNKDAFGAIS